MPPNSVRLRPAMKSTPTIAKTARLPHSTAALIVPATCHTSVLMNRNVMNSSMSGSTLVMSLVTLESCRKVQRSAQATCATSA